MPLENLPDTVEMPLPVPPAAAEDRERTPSDRVRVEIGARSHRGLVRGNNEDYYLVARFGRYLHTLITNLPDDAPRANHQEIGYGFVVADGMGGTSGGEIASRAAVESLVQLVLTT